MARRLSLVPDIGFTKTQYCVNAAWACDTHHVRVINVRNQITASANGRGGRARSAARAESIPTETGRARSVHKPVLDERVRVRIAPSESSDYGHAARSLSEHAATIRG